MLKIKQRYMEGETEKNDSNEKWQYYKLLSYKDLNYTGYTKINRLKQISCITVQTYTRQLYKSIRKDK